MKHNLFVCAAMTLTMAFSATAQNVKIQEIDFAAPIVKDKIDAAPNLRLGSIVFDTASLSFAGLDNFGNWVTLGVSPVATRSSAEAWGGAGVGSSNTTIRTFSNETTTGTAITYADDAIVGASFIVNEAGIYSISYSDFSSTAETVFGISKNVVSPTPPIDFSIVSITAAQRVQATGSPTNVLGNVSVTLPLNAGDVLRAHTDGSTNGTGALVKFVITKVSN